MNTIDKIKNDYKVGQTIFKQLFEMSDVDLKTKLISILDGQYDDILKSNCDCIRTIKNSEPEKIEFYFYDGLVIDWIGVSIKPENGCEYNIVRFNNHFKL